MRADATVVRKFSEKGPMQTELEEQLAELKMRPAIHASKFSEKIKAPDGRRADEPTKERIEELKSYSRIRPQPSKN